MNFWRRSSRTSRREKLEMKQLEETGYKDKILDNIWSEQLV
jgi:hypothetical protein